MSEAFPQSRSSNSRIKFIIGGLLIVAAIVYLIASSTQANAQYFMTVDEILERQDDLGDREIRVSGVVLGDTIDYDSQDLLLNFTIAHVPGDNKDLEDEGGLAMALHAAAIDPTRQRIDVVYNGPVPDLLQHEAQAIMTGHMGDDGVFYADELLLKCPTKYEEAVPEQAEG